MKRRTTNAQKPKLRDRRTGKSPYAKRNKIPYRYIFKQSKGPEHEFHD